MLQSSLSRSNTLRSIKSVFKRGVDDQRQQSDNETNSASQITPTKLFSVHLPQSMSNMDSVSPRLWGWVTDECSDVDEPRVFTQSGQEVMEIPQHLTASRSQLMMSHSLSQQSFDSDYFANGAKIAKSHTALARFVIIY